MALTPQQIADKWAQKAAASANDYKTGIMGVTEAPGQRAVAAQDQLLQRFTEAVTSGRWAARTGAVSLSQWQQMAATKGASNFATGVNAGKAKMLAAVQYYQPVAEQIKAAVRSIPRDGGAGSLQRVQVAMQMFQQAKQNRR